MAVIKCKMCGGDLTLSEGQSVAECEYCGRQQTVPSADNEKKLSLFVRAHKLRAACEFDKAAGIYESIAAEFPDEAESYWGLVLCKYGIEYVDDPATGKKIPTCHRSSFDSVMDDPNFEQALENADAVARRVYREEAKQIEELRKGIIAVSSREEPYDIFICYKETGEDGERTLDSVLAQDIYDALTDKGYRVFFSRITLEDKLGQEYEPYIFAALNSAKIMLAIGTDYEYFNAVWVKNEWSRFLKLMASDKTKHLIPCFKGIDAYDMPKEFAKLQGQDLGKMGAIQDILRGVEKLLPKQEQNTVIIQQNINSNGSALLKRGFMALEDGEWAQADEFFEEVLNQNAECAEAYLGKALAAEKVATLDGFVDKKLDLLRHAKAETLSIPADTARCDAAAKNIVPGYLDARTIRALYPFDLSYPSTVAMRKRQRSSLTDLWNEHKHLSRAAKFAGPELKKQLSDSKNYLVSCLDQRVSEAEANEAKQKKNLQDRYAVHLLEADAKAEKLYEDACRRREQDYQAACRKMERSETSGEFNRAAEAFDKLGKYENSLENARLCRQKARDYDAEQARIAAEEEAERRRIQAEKEAAARAEAERQRVLREKAEKERREKNKKIAIISLSAIAVVIAVVLVLTQVVIPGSRYKEAAGMLAAGDYAGAKAAFENLGSFKDSPEMVKEADYQHAIAFMQEEQYDYAIILLNSLGAYRDSADLAVQAAQAQQIKIEAEIAAEKARIEAENAAAYAAAEELLAQEDYAGAIAAFEALGSYRDSAKRAQQAAATKLALEMAAAYMEAETMLSEGRFDAAIAAFEALGDYEDSPERKQEATYAKADHAMAEGKYIDAIAVFEALGDYSDAPERLKEAYYQRGMTYLGAKSYRDAVIAFKNAGDYSDARKKVKEYQLKDVQVGDTVIFGTYEQDNDTNNGKEDIEWVVVAKDGDKVLLLSKYCLDYRSFNNKKSNAWSGSALRTWLNGTFYKAAFSSAEKNSIKSVSHEYYTNKKSTDKVFLLSTAEAKKCSEEIRMTTATPYAVAQGARSGNNAPWWLRTQDYNIHYVYRVSIDGSIGGYGEVYDWSKNVTYKKMAVRPAIWVTCS